VPSGSSGRPPASIAVDYLVIGAGVSGMAFADVIAGEGGATMAVVDRNDAPGGHWTMAYPFVRLHGASDAYGVHSRAMPSDTVRGNRASRSEILDYYDRVMRETLLESGRVTYLPMHNVDRVVPGRPATARARSLVSGQATEIVVKRRVVDASYMDITVPAMRRRSYEVQEGVPLVTVNDLVSPGGTPERYTVIGAGKTGLDACLWLLNRGVDPDRITWIVSREAWLLTRNLGSESPEYSQLQRLLDCHSVEEVINALEELELIIRRASGSAPTTFRCATVSFAELALLRQIRHVVRRGRIRRIDAAGVHFDGGDLATPPGTVYVDCSADGLTQRPLKPVFADGAITLQPLLPCLLAPSAAVIGKLESLDIDDDARNRLATPVLNPGAARDVVAYYAVRMERLHQWSGSPALYDWFRRSRLAGATPGIEDMHDEDNRTAAARLATHLWQVLKEDGTTAKVPKQRSLLTATRRPVRTPVT
jgi:hypothetical protein